MAYALHQVQSQICYCPPQGIWLSSAEAISCDTGLLALAGQDSSLWSLEYVVWYWSQMPEHMVRACCICPVVEVSKFEIHISNLRALSALRCDRFERPVALQTDHSSSLYNCGNDDSLDLVASSMIYCTRWTDWWQISSTRNRHWIEAEAWLATLDEDVEPWSSNLSNDWFYGVASSVWSTLPHVRIMASSANVVCPDHGVGGRRSANGFGVVRDRRDWGPWLAGEKG